MVLALYKRNARSTDSVSNADLENNTKNRNENSAEGGSSPCPSFEIKTSGHRVLKKFGLIIIMLVACPNLYISMSIRSLNDEDQSAEFRKLGNTEDRIVHWMNSTSIVDIDYFSASWLAPLDAFLQSKTDQMHIVEDACHRVYEQHRGKVRMSADWMDFSVEHMSKWWKILGGIEPYNSVTTDRLYTNFMQYIKSTSSSSGVHPPTVLYPTIAIIPFASYVKNNSPIVKERSTKVTVASLGATIASLNRVGMGRVVVVGVKDEDEALVRETFQLLKKYSPLPSNTDTEYGYVQVKNEKWYKTKFLAVNVPRAAVVGLQHAFNGHLSDEETKLWLGNSAAASSWKYVYLTEPDTILQTRIESLKAIHTALEDGMILMPHRLQPLPHESDLDFATTDNDDGDDDDGSTRTSSSTISIPNYVHLTGKFADKPVIDLYNQEDACCDQGTHPRMDIEPCGNFWYACGFDNQNHNVTEHDRRHKRLLPYDFIRLREGTNIVSLAATEHGRMCRPEKRPGFVCKPPDVVQRPTLQV